MPYTGPNTNAPMSSGRSEKSSFKNDGTSGIGTQCTEVQWQRQLKCRYGDFWLSKFLTVLCCSHRTPP